MSLKKAALHAVQTVSFIDPTCAPLPQEGRIFVSSFLPFQNNFKNFTVFLIFRILRVFSLDRLFIDHIN